MNLTRRRRLARGLPPERLSSFRRARWRLPVPRWASLLLGLWLLLTTLGGPFQLYRCLPMNMGLSLAPHSCCAKKDPKKLKLEAKHGGCCEKIKDASEPVPAQLVLMLDLLELPVAFLPSFPRLEPPTLTGVEVPAPSARGPPLASPPPLYLLNRSLLC